MPAKVYYENDADLGLISDKLVAILGYTNGLSTSRRSIAIQAA